MGISRAQRLKHRSEFAAVYKSGRSFRDSYLVLRVLRSDGPVTRFGFTAGKAVGGAVVRNKVKRRLREIIGSLSVAKGWDIVLNARSTAAKAPYGVLFASAEGLMRRAGVLQ